LQNTSLWLLFQRALGPIRVSSAKGILQSRNGLTEEEAYLHLRGESRRLRKPMRNLAEAVILAEELHRKSLRAPDYPIKVKAAVEEGAWPD
jgi:hypothetical protein